MLTSKAPCATLQCYKKVVSVFSFLPNKERGRLSNIIKQNRRRREMSDKKPLLETVLDQLDREFHEIGRLLWIERKPINQDTENRITPLLRALHDANLTSNDNKDARRRLTMMRHRGTEWLSINKQLAAVVYELEKQ